MPDRKDWLGPGLVNTAERHAVYERKEKIRATFEKAAADQQLIDALPVTFTNLENSSINFTGTGVKGYSVPLVGGGELVLGRKTIKIGDNNEAIQNLTVRITTDNPRGSRITTPTVVVDKYNQDFIYLKPGDTSNHFSEEFATSETLNTMANFQPGRDIDWQAIKDLDSPVLQRLTAIWK